MSAEELNAFIAKVKADPSLVEKLKSVDTEDAVISIAKSSGFEITADDIKANQPDELTAEELENVAGGRWRGQFGYYPGCFWSLFDAKPSC